MRVPLHIWNLTTRITIVSIHVIWVIEYRLLVGVDRMVVGLLSKQFFFFHLHQFNLSSTYLVFMGKKRPSTQFDDKIRIFDCWIFFSKLHLVQLQSSLDIRNTGRNIVSFHILYNLVRNLSQYILQINIILIVGTHLVFNWGGRHKATAVSRHSFIFVYWVTDISLKDPRST